MDPYIGEIRIFAGTYAPEGWLFCQGQTLPVAQYQALYAVIGNTYGGDGKKTFALPDLRGRAPVSQGQGTGLSMYGLGKAGGASTVTLSVSQLPTHNHLAKGTTNLATTTTPANGIWARSGAGATGVSLYANDPKEPLNANALLPAGNSQPHNNLQPCLGINFIIAVDGEFPVRS
ncbi:MAG: phage tail protein [Chloroflexi bacterium]|nr:phage tail protein [Chloroflexota bacterium]